VLFSLTQGRTGGKNATGKVEEEGGPWRAR